MNYLGNMIPHEITLPKYHHTTKSITILIQGKLDPRRLPAGIPRPLILTIIAPPRIRPRVAVQRGRLQHFDDAPSQGIHEAVEDLIGDIGAVIPRRKRPWVCLSGGRAELEIGVQVVQVQGAAEAAAL